MQRNIKYRKSRICIALRDAQIFHIKRYGKTIHIILDSLLNQESELEIKRFFFFNSYIPVSYFKADITLAIEQFSKKVKAKVTLGTTRH